MKAVLVTTTINVPEVLRLYREMQADVHFIVVGDRKTPDAETGAFVRALGNAQYFSAADQTRLGYACSELIGWNTIMRRNIAILEAVKLKPDFVVTIDDDNIPVGTSYFDDLFAVFSKPFSGLIGDHPSGWFNAAAFMEPPTFHRGYPYSRRGNVQQELVLRPTVRRRVGVAAGLWAGDPDIDAMTRIVAHPQPLGWSPLMDAGVTVAPGTYAPYNTQNTAFHADLAALMHVWIGVGRYDDIWSSYVAQRVMRDLDFVVHFGKPFVWQQRNLQSPWRNLSDEMLGMQHTDAFVGCIESVQFSSADVLDRLRTIYEATSKLPFMPEITARAGLAFCDDFERIASR